MADFDDDDLDEDPRIQIEGDVAEYLAALSTAADVPTEFDSSPMEFDSGDVDFTSDAWMSKLAEVQGWMRWGSTIAADSPEAFMTDLVSLLGFRDTSEGLTNDSELKLSIIALDRLRERAERATRLQRGFVEALEEEGGTRASATRAWISAWEEEEEGDEYIEPEPVSARADIWPISTFLGSRLNLAPSYQRGDVWRTSARQVLIESILRGIPLPSVILMRPTEPSQPFEVVDGKQRLTAILRFVGKHPIALENVEAAAARHPEADLMGLFVSDYPRFRRAWKSLEHESLTSSKEDEYYFPFRLRTDDKGLTGDLAPLRGRYYTEIRDSAIRAADQQLSIAELFERVPDYKVPVIVYTRANPRQIHEVFNLYNKQGMHLNAEEIRNAIYHELELTRAILVAAGDSDRHSDVAEIAPALVSDWPTIEYLQDTLTGYGFGASRYRRTKVVSWVIATLLGDTGGDSYPSTARHIDALLTRVQSAPQDPLRKPDKIGALFAWVSEAAELHASHGELWSPRFRDGTDAGTKWQELQLVGSLVGVAIALAAAPSDIEDRIAANAADIFSASASAAWRRPTKTQTKTQWAYIGRIAFAVCNLLGVDVGFAGDEIRRRFGSSGVESLQAVVVDVGDDLD